jgi:hypothetical protein
MGSLLSPSLCWCWSSHDRAGGRASHDVYPLVSGAETPVLASETAPEQHPWSERAPTRLLGGPAAEVKGERKTPWVRWALHGR